MSSDRFALVREHQLRELVTALDRALDILELCSFLETNDGTGGTLLAVPLRSSSQIEATLRRASDFLAALKYRGSA
jgi:hypothetical protein